MRVIVGKRAMPTPLMAGLIRYAMLNPYWNLPPDLIRERARKRRPGAIAAERLQVLSDWTPQARAARSAPGRLARGRAPAAASSICARRPGAAQHDGPDQVHDAQRSRRLSARYAAPRPARAAPTAIELGLRPPRGRAAARPLAVRRRGAARQRRRRAAASTCPSRCRSTSPISPPCPRATASSSSRDAYRRDGAAPTRSPRRTRRT